MNNQTLREAMRDAIAAAAWRIFLWAIRMTAEEYWMAAYKQERNRMCIESEKGELDERTRKVLSF